VAAQVIIRIAPSAKRSEREETGNPLVADAACGAGLSGLSRRSFSEDGSEASAKKCGEAVRRLDTGKEK
jgi:hypothetical protein